jgi:AmmeMemoRadiSam system protein B
MSTDRQPAVAGLFYPADPATLAREVDSLLDGAAVREDVSVHAAPKALVCPHAGYVYSGSVAASAYVRLAAVANRVTRVVLLGPAHRWPFRGIAYPSAERLLTPLGPVPVDREAIASIADLPRVERLDGAFDREHCLEVQLPFLQRVLGTFSVVPLVVGAARPRDVESVIDQLWDGDETLILVSSDLSHYLDYETGRRLDRETSASILALDSEALDHERACGATPLAGLLLAARRRGLEASLIDLRSSGDTAGPRDQVVGYGAYVFA